MQRFQVSEPCGEDWDRMEVRAGGRHCARCEHVVVDLSETTLARAEAIARAARGELCVRIAVDEDGDALFRPPPLVPIRRAAGGLALALMVAGCDPPAEAGCAVPIGMEAPLEPAPLETDFGATMLPVEQGGAAPASIAQPSIAQPSIAQPSVAGLDEQALARDATHETSQADAGGEVGPTAEQRARTRRKEASQRPRQLRMGRMPISRYRP